MEYPKVGILSCPYCFLETDPFWRDRFSKNFHFPQVRWFFCNCQTSKACGFHGSFVRKPNGFFGRNLEK